MNRRKFFRSLSLAAVTASTLQPRAGAAATLAGRRQRVRSFELNEWSIEDLQRAMATGRLSSVSATKKYLARIEEIDRQGPKLNAVIEVNPDALAIAAELDRERKTKGTRGPLHGIPILLKDNIATRDRMQTTAGSLALVGAIPPRDAFLVERLRRAGAVILGKTNLSEWANIRSSHSTSGWSGRGGLTLSPYALDRNPSGSSSGSGVAVAANLCAVAVGTETDGSILSPSSYSGLVGIKPTVGLISRAGIIPIAHIQDTAGPMARTVKDAAILLGAMTGVDPRDAATGASEGKALADYAAAIDPRGLRGARIGVARKFFGILDRVDALLEDSLRVMKRMGAVLVDPADLPTHGQYSEAELEVLLYELKHDLNLYLAELGPGAAVRTLKEVIDFNEKNKAREMPHFSQDLFVRAEAKGPLTTPAYLEALKKNHRLTRAEGIDAVMNEHKLDAMVAPTTGPTQLTDLLWGDRDTGGSTTPPAVAGYPSITVPAGQVMGLPVGISFFGSAWSEAKLLSLAFAFEQATHGRKPPRFLPTLTLDDR